MPTSVKDAIKKFEAAEEGRVAANEEKVRPRSPRARSSRPTLASLPSLVRLTPPSPTSLPPRPSGAPVRAGTPHREDGRQSHHPQGVQASLPLHQQHREDHPPRRDGQPADPLAGQDLIKKIDNLDGVADTLEELWISYNLIEKLTNVDKLTKLRVLYVSNNKVENYKELEKLTELSGLEELLLVGNPLWEAAEKPEEIGCEYRIEVLKRVPQLLKLNGIPVDVDEEGRRRPRRRGSLGAVARCNDDVELSSSPWFVHKDRPRLNHTSQRRTRARARDRGPPWPTPTPARAVHSKTSRRGASCREEASSSRLNRGANRPSASTSLRRRRRVRPREGAPSRDRRATPHNLRYR